MGVGFFYNLTIERPGSSSCSLAESSFVTHNMLYLFALNTRGPLISILGTILISFHGKDIRI